jgi:hypothetical protein
VNALLIVALSVFALSSQDSHAASLKCASKKEQTLYYSEGQVMLLVKDIVSETLMFDSSISLQPLGKLGTREKTVNGSFSGNSNWVRFKIGADAWCNYRLALPRGFHKIRGNLTAYVDAYCEENSNYNIRLSCKID